jgi:hypothetical protein
MKYESYCLYVRAMVYQLNYIELRKLNERKGMDLYGTKLAVCVEDVNYLPPADDEEQADAGENDELYVNNKLFNIM